MFGEHGDTSFVPWSLANISNIPVDMYQDALVQKDCMVPSLSHEEVEVYMRKSGGRVIARKGATFYAISISVCYICKCLLSSINTTTTVSTMMHGEYGIDDVCISTLNIIGHSGVVGKLLSPLNDEETLLLRKSADSLKDVIKNLDI